MRGVCDSLALASSATSQGDSLRTFHALSTAHALVVIVFIIVAALVLGAGLQRRGTPRQRPFERVLGITGLIIWILANGYGFLPGVFRWDASLPVHVCDIAALLGPLVMLCQMPPPWMRSLLYFAGIGLCTQAFITPTLHEGPADPQFWCFWSGHYCILIPALYELLVRRWRPTWRHWGIAIGLSLGYLAVMFPLDAMFHWNYGFLGQARQPGTMIEVLGSWPRRVPIIVGLVVLAYTLMMLPWMSLPRNAPPPVSRQHLD
jgi:hypothetical integral membrane protein (TIGR02206 family)